MEKRIKIFAIVLFVIVVLVLFSSLKQAARMSKPSVVTPSIAPRPTYYPRPTFGPVASLVPAISLPSAEDGKIDISDVRMNNFYKAPKRINSTGDVLIADSDLSQIVYLPKYNKFIISILSSSFEENKPVAEGEFLKVLGINRKEACRLNVAVNTPFFANPQYSGKDYPLSFCQGQ